MSKTSLCAVISSSVFVAFALMPLGCRDDPDPNAPPPPPLGFGPGPAPPPGGMAAEPIGAKPSIRQIMGKLTKGPGSLTAVIGNELKADPPAWDTIAPQTQEYTRLAAAMGDNTPPKGSADSWKRLTTDFAGSAESLSKAAQAKDREAALEAHGVLANSCNACHREHRRGPGGMGMGGPPMGGPPMGGPPGKGQRGGTPKGAPPPPEN
jgi:hypothetical protein